MKTTRRVLTFVGILIVLAVGFMGMLLSSRADSFPPSLPSPPLIHLQYGTFDPLASEPELPVAQRLSVQERRPATYLVQFTGPVREAWKAAVEASGARLYGYVPDFAFIARMEAATAEAVEALTFVRWVGPYHPAYRLAPTLQETDVGLPAPEVVTVTVQTLPDADLDRLAARIQGWGGEVQGRARNELAGYLRVAVTRGRLDDVTALDGVLWVEPYFEPQLYNDVGGGTIMRTAEVRADLGLYGSGQVVAVADSGLDTGNQTTLHPDVRGRVVKAYCLGRPDPCDWSDYVAHGTHVAGSVLGDGTASGSDPAAHDYTASYAGVAPEAQLVFQSVADAQGSLSGIPTDRGDLMRTAYGDGARIHTNSWGGPTGGTPQDPEYGGYVDASQQVDQAAWEHEDMLVLYSAGNNGVDVNSDGVIDQDSIGQPGTAKNVLTVGASENDRAGIASTWGDSYAEPIASDTKADEPDGLAAFSSRGPTDDGRVKPDVVAPGTYIASLRTRQYAFEDDMEAAGTPDLYTKLYSGGGTGDAWQWSTGDAHSSSHYWGATASGTYNPGAMSILLTPVMNVFPTGGAFDLIFWHKYSLSGDNQLALLLTDNDLAPQFWLTLDLSGNQTGYQPQVISLPTVMCDQQTQQCIDPSNFGVGFAIYSESGGYNSQWWLDDVRVDGADWGTMSSLGLAQPGDAIDEAYLMMGGTSMATPLTAGGAAIVREWLTEQQGVGDPSAALVKAVLINGAVEMSPGQYGTGATREIPDYRPNYVTGWGRVDLKESLDPPPPREVWFADHTAGLSTGGAAVYTLTVGSTQNAGVQRGRGAEDLDNGRRLSFDMLGEAESFVGPLGFHLQGTTQLLQNPGFESGAWSPWQTDGSPYLTSIIKHGGTYAAHMGNNNDADDQIWQEVDIPADATNVTMDFWYRLRTEETWPYVDYFCVGIWHQSGSPAYVLRCADFGQTGDVDWTQETYSLNATELLSVTGQTVLFGFFVQTDYSLPSRAWVDDTALTVTTTGGVSPTLTITPESGPRGTTFSVAGSNFNADDTVTITIDATDQFDVTSDGGGGFSFDLTPPGTESKGNHTVTATDSSGHNASDTYGIVPQVNVSVSPASGQAGDSFSVTGSGFHGESTITVTLDGAHDGTPTADADGAFTYTLNTDAGIADGTHTVGASDDEGSNASDTFTIGGGGETCPEVLDDGGFEASTGDTSNPYWNASDNARFFNTPGGGHGSSDYVALLGYNDTPSTGEVWQSVSVSADAVSGTLSFWYQDWGDNAFALDVDITDGGGSILVDLPDLTGGDSAWQQYNHTFTSGEMTNIAGQSVRLRFRIRDISEIEDVAVDDVSWRICSGSTPPEQRQVSVMPASGPNGTTFTITGTNFTASAVVTLTVDGAFVKTTTADGSGAFSTTYTPISLDVGQHTLVANDGDGQAQTTFEISSPQTGGPFRVTLAWTDYPGSPTAGKALVNDLDLEIVAPDGTHYYGNQDLYDNGGDPYGCRRGGQWDQCNNVEGVIVPQATYGTYTVIVHGYNVPQGPQPFAVVASGDNLDEYTGPPPEYDNFIYLPLVLRQ